MKALNPTLRPWLWLYVVANIVGSLIMLNTGELIGDVAGNSLGDPKNLLISLFFTVGSYLVILWPGFNLVSTIAGQLPLKCGCGRGFGDVIGRLLIVGQLGFAAFNFIFEVNAAGSIGQASSPLSLLWVLFPVDSLFLIYYVVHRENKFLKVNLFIWLISLFMRGWMGAILLIAFVEWCRARRNGFVIRFRHLLVGVPAMLLYPVLTIIKFSIRAAGIKGLSFGIVAESVATNIDNMGFVNSISQGFTHFIGRIQTTSILVEVMRTREMLHVAYMDGRFAPFWFEGLHGIILGRLFDLPRPVSIGVAFTEFVDFGWAFEVGSWNTNVGLPAWLFIDPGAWWAFLLYLFCLAFLSMVLARMIDDRERMRELVWLSWLIYMLPPWLGQFVAFIYALFVYLCIVRFLGWYTARADA